jgi:hypothetical protein
MLPADSALAFDDLGNCDSDICGGILSVKSKRRQNLEFVHEIWPTSAFLPQLDEDVLYMRLHRFKSDGQIPGNFVVGQTLSNQSEDVAFARAQ